MMRARRTSECGMLRECTIDCSCKRSASSIVNALFGLPIPATSLATLADAVACVKLIMGHYTSCHDIWLRNTVTQHGFAARAMILVHGVAPVLGSNRGAIS